MDLELLKIYTLSQDGASCSAFPGVSSQIELIDYQYVSSRMGTTVVTATVKWPVCLDNAWTGREFVVMDESAGGSVMGKEKFFLLHRPGSEKGSDDERYVHTLEFQSERDVVLNSVYFLDAVSGTADKYVSNSWSVKFFGTLSEFVGRYTAVLSRMGLGSRFSIVIDSGVSSADVKEVSFEKATLFEVLQQSYDVWGVPFYFVGNVIHFGEGSVVSPAVVFEYGHDEELLGVEKVNTGAKLVTRCSGYGSSDNIPYYYPNPTPKGMLKAGYNGAWSTESGSLLSIVNQRKFSSGLDLADTLTYVGKGAAGKAVGLSFSGYSASSSQGSQSASLQGITVFTHSVGWSWSVNASFGLNGGYRGRVTLGLGMTAVSADTGVTDLRILDGKGNVTNSRAAADVAKYGWAIGVDKVRMTVSNPNNPSDKVTRDVPFSVEYADVYATQTSGDQASRTTGATQYWQERTAKAVTVDVADALDSVFAGLSSYLTTGNVTIEILPVFSTRQDWWVKEGSAAATKASFTVTLSASASWTPGGWKYGTKSEWLDDLSTIGLSYTGAPAVNDVISQGVVNRIPPSEYLMPSVYRTSGGAERFYNAINNTYPVPGSSPAAYYTFPNVYDARSPREHVEEFSDIMPTVRNLTDGQGNPLNVFDAVFFEEGFNAEETDAEGKLKYNWFFVKLKALGFSLFDSASESGEMSFSMLSGHCAGCRFKVVADKLGHNPVAVKQDGTLDVDATTKRVKMLDEPQAVQQDSTSSQIWIALYLDAETFGGTEVEMGVLPNASVKPSANDSYAILDIDLPDAYILAAEQRLQEEIVRFMWENNDDKYSYNIHFSRVWLAQNPSVRAALNAHCSLNLRYNGVTLAAPLHVSQYTYRAVEGESLPEISVELSDIIEAPSSGLEQKIAAQVDDVVNVVRGAGGLKIEETDARYVRRDIDDTIDTIPTFLKGLKVGSDSGMDVNGAGESVLDVDWLNVRKKAVFSQVEIDRLRQVGGRLLVSLASISCSAVEEISSNNVVTSYRCFFKPVGNGGEALENGFVAGDLAICQSFGNGSPRYWWRRVLEAGSDYIVVSNVSGQYDSGSDVPAVGDEIVQLGNVSDASRQAAQVLSCTGADSPSLVAYVGVNGFSLAGKDIYGVKYVNVSGSTYQPYFFNYGSMLLGDRAKTSDYVEYDHTNGLMTIKANVVFKAGQSLSGITEFSDLSGSVDDLSDEVDEVSGDVADAKTDIVTLNTAVGAIQTDIAGWPTVKAALNGATAISGGLVLTSMIQLGQKVGDVFTVKSGINGVYDSSKTGGGIAGWYGGNMWDLEHLGSGQTAAGAAKSLFRFDGTGYLASGKITWDADGYGQLGGTSDDYVIKWTANGVQLGKNIKFGASSDTVETIVNHIADTGAYRLHFSQQDRADLTSMKAILDLFEYDATNHTLGIKKVNDQAISFWTYGNVTAGDVGGGGGGGGSAVWGAITGVLSNQTDLYPELPKSILTALGGIMVGAGSGDTPTMLTIGNVGQILKVGSNGVPVWGDAPATGVTSIGGKTGAITLGSNLSINASNVLSCTYSYSLPIASASTLGGVKVGTNLSIDANGVLSATDTTYESKAAASGGTAVSLVTTGEKYTWNSKQNALTAGSNITISGNTISAADTHDTNSAGTGIAVSGTRGSTIGISSTYQTYISHGESAYNSLGNYLLKTGGAMSLTGVGALKLNVDSIHGVVVNRGGSGWSVIRYDKADALLGFLGFTAVNTPAYISNNAAAYTLYHSGNCNNTSTAWSASSLTLNGAISGATNITASNFIKSGSSDSYVLLGGGGHKAESSLSVLSYGGWAGSFRFATVGWWRVAKLRAGSSDVAVYRNWTSQRGEAYSWRIGGTSYHGNGINIDQLTGDKGVPIITKVRANYNFNEEIFFEIYIGTATSDTYYVSVNGNGTYITPTLITSTLSYTKELATGDGMRIRESLIVAGSVSANSATFGSSGAADAITINSSASGTASYTIGSDSTSSYNLKIANNQGTGCSLVLSSAGNVLIPTGNVGIGTTSPSYKLHVNNTSGHNYICAQSVTGYDSGLCAKGSTYELYFIIGSGGVNRGIYDQTNAGWMLYRDATTNVLIPTGNVGIGTTAPSAKLHVSGDILATGNVSAGSDLRWKEHITDFDDNGILKALSPVEWDWKEGHGKGHASGFIAQDIQKIMPYAVGGSEEGGYVLNYNCFHALWAKSLQNHETRVEYLERRVKELESKLKQLTS